LICFEAPLICIEANQSKERTSPQDLLTRGFCDDNAAYLNNDAAYSYNDAGFVTMTALFRIMAALFGAMTALF